MELEFSWSVIWYPARQDETANMLLSPSLIKLRSSKIVEQFVVHEAELKNRDGESSVHRGNTLSRGTGWILARRYRYPHKLRRDMQCRI